MSTPDNRSVNFFSLFRRGQHYAKSGQWKAPRACVCREPRNPHDALRDPFYAALSPSSPYAGKLR